MRAPRAACRSPNSSRASSRSTRRSGVPDCSGLGTRREVSPDLLLGDPSLSILEGVILPWGEPSGYVRKVILPSLARTSSST